MPTDPVSEPAPSPEPLPDDVKDVFLGYPEFRAALATPSPEPLRIGTCARCDHSLTDHPAGPCRAVRFPMNCHCPMYLRSQDVERLAATAQPPLNVERPEIVCLCGSTRFYDVFQAANYDLTMLGKIVLSVGFYPHSKAIHGHGEGVGHDSAEKDALDELHKRKIDLADRVYVLNVGGYIGSSTRGEIEYAEARGKPVDYLEPLAARLGGSPNAD